MKRYLTPIIFGLVILGLVIFAILALRSPDKSSSSSTDQSGAVLKGDDLKKLQTGWDQGPADAKVILVEFGDYQCPACGNAHPILKNTLLPQYGGKIRFVFKNYPLTQIHKNALASAEAAEAAGAQGKYWPMHDLLYEKQDEWAGLPDPVDKFGAYAASIGLDAERLKREVRDSKYQSKIDEDKSFGEKLKLSGTPSFFVNGQYIDLKTNGLEDIKSAIDAALSK